MAIAFPYYLAKTDLLPSLSDAWLEPATIEGNFLVNSTGFLTRRLINSGEDFTLIVTTDRLISSNNSGAVGILKGDNWSFGIDSSNFFFVNSKKESYTFDQITLGKKNCFALAKNGNGFTVTKYNVPSQEIENSQTQYFTPASQPTGTGLIFAEPPSVTGVRNFYGTVDQLVLFNQPLADDNLSTLFSGFLKQTVIYTPPPTTPSLKYVNWEGDFNITTQARNLFLSGATLFAEDFPTYISNSNTYYGTIDFINGPSYEALFQVDSSPIQQLCPSDGLEEFGYEVIGPATGLPSLIIAPAYINYQQFADSLYSFDFSQVTPGLSLNLTYGFTGSTSAVVAQNTGYYSGFYMYGIVSPEAHATMLASFPTGYQYVNKLGAFDVVFGHYLAPGAISNDRVFLDGVPETGYSLSGDYLDILNLVETNENQLIYDQVNQSGIVLQFFNTKNFSTGQFFPKTAAGFTGDQSFAGMWRVLQPEFIETHPYHLYHGKEIPTVSGTNYNNLDDFWN